jgi:hypothetical protein
MFINILIKNVLKTIKGTSTEIRGMFLLHHTSTILPPMLDNRGPQIGSIVRYR